MNQVDPRGSVASPNSLVWDDFGFEEMGVDLSAPPPYPPPPVPTEDESDIGEYSRP